MPIRDGSTFAQSPDGALRRHLFEFGAYHLDVLNHRLVRLGEPIPITPKTLDLLLILLRHRDRVVAKGELMKELWADTAVEEANLTQQVFALRKILGEDPSAPSYIETVPRRGYRFAADVREVREEGTAPVPARALSTDHPGQTSAETVPSVRDGRRRRTTAALAFLTVMVAAGLGWRYWPNDSSSHPVVLTVLPFQNLDRSAATGAGSEGPELGDFLSIGIPDAIITRLSAVRQFRVRPTSAVARYDGGAIDAQEVGRKLGSQYVLVGTIRATVDRVRVSVQLLRTNDGAPVWGRQYDRARADLLDIEDAVADEISGALRVQMSDAERDRFYRRYTRNGAAYERYLMGRSKLRAVTEEHARSAITEFEAARDLDKNYALAYAGIATAAAQLRVRFGSRKDYEIWDARARREAGHALQLDPDLAEAHVALAAVHRFQEYDWDTVIRESRRALELNPSLDVPHLYLAVAYFHIGLLEEAAQEIDVARELNPENRVEPLEILGAISLYSGRIEEAVSHLSQVQDSSDSRIVRYLLGWTLYYRGERERAETLLETMGDVDGPLPGNARATLAAVRAARGAKAEARALAERVAAEPDLIHHGTYGLGTAYAQLGEPAVALRWLSQAATTGFPCYPWYERDPLLDPIRDDPQFAAFMRELRRTWENARAKYTTSLAQTGAT